MQSIRKISLLIFTLFSLGMILMPYAAEAAAAKDELDKACQANPGSSFCAGYTDPGNPGTKSDGVLVGIVNILSYAAGVLAVVFLVYGGFKYVKSSGDSNKVSEAKQTIIYALAGLVVVVLSRTLVLYILDIV